MRELVFAERRIKCPLSIEHTFLKLVISLYSPASSQCQDLSGFHSIRKNGYKEEWNVSEVFTIVLKVLFSKMIFRSLNLSTQYAEKLRSGEKGPYCKYGEDQRYLPIPALPWELCQRVSCGVNKAFVQVSRPLPGTPMVKRCWYFSIVVWLNLKTSSKPYD